MVMALPRRGSGKKEFIQQLLNRRLDMAKNHDGEGRTAVAHGRFPT
jgi:hypothetical protein